MPELIEKQGTGAFISSEGNGNISRERIIVNAASILEVGQVYGTLDVGGNAVPFDPVGSDGSENPKGITYAYVDATDGDTPGLGVVRLAEVNAAEIVWPDGISDVQRDAAIVALGLPNIIFR